MATDVASKRLWHEYRLLYSTPPEGILAYPIDESKPFVWEAFIDGPKDTPFEGGVFPAILNFPKDYPLSPPKMKFLGEIFHPNGMCTLLYRSAERSNLVLFFFNLNLPEKLADAYTRTVYPNGEVCISILHPPGDDPNHYESASERWSPIQSIEKILISVMSMLAEPNDESPANVEAAKMWRDDRAQFEEKVKDGIWKSLGLEVKK